MDAGTNVGTVDRETETGIAPVIFVPGFGHAQQGWDLLRRHLCRAGFSDIGSFDAPPAQGDVPHRAERLAQHLDAVRSLTGCRRVHLVGHNVGGVVARYFVQLLGGDEVVDTVVTIGSAHAGSDLAPVGLGPAAAQLRPGSAVLRHLDESTRPLHVRWLNYFAEHDVFLMPVTSALLRDARMRAVNILVTDHGHLSLSIPTVVCRSVAHQLAACSRLPGYGSPVAALPGGVVRLEEAEIDASAAAIARSKAHHPSSYSQALERIHLGRHVGSDG